MKNKFLIVIFFLVPLYSWAQFPVVISDTGFPVTVAGVGSNQLTPALRGKINNPLDSMPAGRDYDSILRAKDINGKGGSKNDYSDEEKTNVTALANAVLGQKTLGVLTPQLGVFPIAKNFTVGGNYTPSGGTLKELKVYIQATDGPSSAFEIVIVRRNVLAMTVVYRLSIPCATTGLKTYTPADFGTIVLGTSDILTIYTPATNAAQPAYLAGTTGDDIRFANAPGAVGATNNWSLGNVVLQYNYTVIGNELNVKETALEASTRTKLARIDKKNAALLLDENLKGSAAAWTLTGAWTQDSTGLKTPTGAGDFTQKAKLTTGTFHVEQRISRVGFAIQGAGARFAVGYEGQNISGESTTLTAFQVDDANNLLKIHTAGTSGETTVLTSVAIPALTVGEEYELRIDRNYRINTVTLINRRTGVVIATVSHGTNSDTNLNTTSGSQVGAPILINRTGVTKFLYFNITGRKKNPALYILGDSRTDGFGLLLTNRFSQMVVDSLKGDCVISAMSGSKTTQIPFKIAREIPAIQPKAIAVFLGTNDTDSEIVSYKANINTLRTYCNSNGIKLILEVPPITSRTLTQIRAFLFSLTDVRLVRLDWALSTSNNGTTQDATLYLGGAGDVHENATGNAKMRDRFFVDAAWLFDF